jgi:hypothetical protein
MSGAGSGFDDSARSYADGRIKGASNRAVVAADGT